MKRCAHCLVEKPLDEYHRKPGGKDGRQSACKSCAKVYHRALYEKDKGKVIASNYARREQHAQEVDALKDAPCLDCGAQFEPVCMDFDHREGTAKVMAVSKMVHECASMKRIKEEIAKCDLLCVLCHKTRTHRRLQDRGSTRATSTKVHRRNQAMLALARDRPCAICDVKRHPWQMEFDHLDEKIASVTTLAWGRAGAATIEAEISKCQVLCALCHRRETAARGKWRGSRLSAC